MINPIRGRKKVFSVLFLFSFSAGALAGGTESYVREILSREKFKNARWSISVKFAHNGRKVFSYAADEPLIPASIMKTLVTSAFLEEKGPEYRFRTRLYMDGKVESGTLKGNLYIRGGGDPSFGSHLVEGAAPLESVFRPWVEKIKSMGIRRIKGYIYADGTLFSGPPVSRNWAWEDMGNYYAAWPAALSINDNLYKLCFRPSGKKGGRAELLGMEPEIYGLKFINLMGTGPENSGDNGYIFNMPKNYKAILKGTLPAGRKKFCIKGAIPDPPLFAAQYFARKLSEGGIKAQVWEKVLDKKPDYSSRKLLAETLSPPLRNIIKITNTRSFNLYAELLLRHFSVAQGGDGSLADGLMKLKKHLSSTGIDVSSAFLDDACGLSRLNRAPAELFTDNLVSIYGGKYFYDFYDSLVSPGEKGAKGHIRKFGRGTPLEKNLKIKSGSLKRVRAYCGYLRTKSDKILAFTFIINGYSGGGAEVDSVHREILLRLYRGN